MHFLLSFANVSKLIDPSVWSTNFVNGNAMSIHLNFVYWVIMTLISTSIEDIVLVMWLKFKCSSSLFSQVPCQDLVWHLKARCPFMVFPHSEVSVHLILSAMKCWVLISRYRGTVLSSNLKLYEWIRGLTLRHFEKHFELPGSLLEPCPRA